MWIKQHCCQDLAHSCAPEGQQDPELVNLPLHGAICVTHAEQLHMVHFAQRSRDTSLACAVMSSAVIAVCMQVVSVERMLRVLGGRCAGLHFGLEGMCHRVTRR